MALITGSSGNDLLVGDGSADLVQGLEGDDTIFGNGGLDTILGGAGNDRVETFYGFSLIDGGSGVDSVELDASTFSPADRLSPVTFVVNGVTGSDIVLPDGSSVLGIENFSLHTGSGDDMGTFINPVMLGAEHNFFNGGAGFDRGVIDCRDTSFDVTSVSVFGGFNRWQLSVNGPIVTNVFFEDLEWIGIRTGAGDDFLDGTFEKSVSFKTGGGRDSMIGSSGSDVLSGAGGADSLFGAAGNDRLNGGRGSDWLDGGEGSDDFVFHLERFGADTVAGFDSTEDSIDLTAIDLLPIDFIVRATQGGVSTEIVIIETGSSILLLDVSLESLSVGVNLLI